MRAKPVDWLTAAAVLAVAAGLLLRSAEVAEAVVRGLVSCASTLIPSMFPFMTLAGFLASSQAGPLLSIPLRPLARYVFRLPPEAAAPVLLSFVGGYPVGAKTVAALLENGRIDAPTASRMLCFCVNCSPPFVITAVGAGMLANRQAGVVLFAAQTAATLLIGAAVSLRAEPPRVKGDIPRTPLAEAFVQSVNGAASATVAMCAFVALFSGFLAMIGTSGLPKPAAAALAGFFEVATGCLRAAELGGERAFLLASGAISFGGLAVLFQAAAMFRGKPVRFWPMIMARLAHIPLAMAIGLPFFRRYCGAVPVGAHLFPPIMRTGRNTMAVTACLLCMCVILTISAATPEWLAYFRAKRYNILGGNGNGTCARTRSGRGLQK